MLVFSPPLCDSRQLIVDSGWSFKIWLTIMHTFSWNGAVGIYLSTAFCFSTLQWEIISTPAQIHRCLVAGLPATNSHLQGVVRGEQSRQQGEVGHGAGAVFGINPALNGLFFIWVAICLGWKKLCKQHKKAQSNDETHDRWSQLTSSNNRLLHQFSGDWTQELIGNA